MTRHVSEFGRARTARWITITASTQAFRVLLSIVSAAILGRILRPDDFGLVATTAPILTLVTMLQNLGLNQALVQHPNLSRPHINALFYITLSVSLVLASVLYASAGSVAWFFDEPRLLDITHVLSLLTVVSAAASTPIALLNRRLQFTALAMTELVSALLGVIAGIAFAYIYDTYWALIVMQGVTSLLQLIGSIAWSKWLPGQPQFTPAVREMVGFGAGFSTFNILNFLSRNADKLLIAKSYGTEALGPYDRAYKLMLDPVTQALIPLGRVLTPVLARLRDETGAYRERYLETVTVLMTLTQPGLLLTLVFPEATIRILLGPQWDSAVPIFQWLGLTMLHQIFTSTFGWLFISQGRGRDFAVLGAYSSAVALASFVVGLPAGPVGVAAAYAIADYVVRVPFTLWITGRSGPITTLDLLSAFGPHALAVLSAAIFLFALRAFNALPGFVEMLAFGAVSYAVYFPVLLCFNSKRRLGLAACSAAARRWRDRSRR